MKIAKLLGAGRLFGKRQDTSFAESYSQGKNERIARKALGDLLAFHSQLLDYLKQADELEHKGEHVDHELLARAKLADLRYKTVMEGFRKNNDPNQQRNILIAFADAVQDIMIYLSRKKSHA